MRFVRYAVLGKWWSPSNVEKVASHRALSEMDSRTAVIIPCHNYAQYLPQALESVLRQTRRPSEILIVDDASDDDTVLVAKRYAEQRVRYLRVEHRNLSLTRNSGAAATTAPYMVFLDADDVLAENYLERCLEQMGDTKTAIAYPDIQHTEESRYFLRAPRFDSSLLARSNFIPACAMIRRDAFDAVQGFRVMEGELEDWDFFQRIVRLGYRAKPADTTLYYRVHADSMLQTLSRAMMRA